MSKESSIERIIGLKGRILDCCRSHGFYKEDHSDVFYLGLVMYECGEAINADRDRFAPVPDKQQVDRLVDIMTGKWHYEGDNDLKYNKKVLDLYKLFDLYFTADIKGSVAEELADIIIRLLDLAALRNMNVCPALPGSICDIRAFSTYIRPSNELSEILLALVTFLGGIHVALDSPEFLKYRYAYFGYAVYSVIECIYDVFFEKYGMDIGVFVELKVRYNELRPKFKGERKY